VKKPTFRRKMDTFWKGFRRQFFWNCSKIFWIKLIL